MSTNNNDIELIKTIKEQLDSYPATIALSEDTFLFRNGDNLCDPNGKTVIKDFLHNTETGVYKDLLCCSCISVDAALDSYKNWKEDPIKYTEAIKQAKARADFEERLNRTIDHFKNMFGLFDDLRNYEDEDEDSDEDSYDLN